MENKTDQNQAPLANSQPKNNFSKYSTLILVTLVAALLASGGTYLVLKQSNPKPQNIVQTPSPSPTQTPIISILPTTDPSTVAVWKTYINKQYGYSFQYPNEAIVQEITSKYVSLRKSGTIDTSAYINFFISENPENLSEKNFYTTKQYNLSEGEVSKFVSFTEVSLGNIKALRAINTATQGATGNTDYLIKGNGIMYQINTAEYQGKLNDNTIDIINTGTSPLYKQILSTFKFID